MTPFERFKSSITNGNLWIYILTLTKENHLPKSKVESLVFENFGFLPGKITCQIVLKKLENGGYLSAKKIYSEKSYSLTKRGEEELAKMKNFTSEIFKKL